MSRSCKTKTRELFQIKADGTSTPAMHDGSIRFNLPLLKTRKLYKRYETKAFKHSTKHNITHYVEIKKSSCGNRSRNDSYENRRQNVTRAMNKYA